MRNVSRIKPALGLALGLLILGSTSCGIVVQLPESGTSTTEDEGSGGGGVGNPCPTNFVRVPGSATAGLVSQDFCVARYEMKAVVISSGALVPNGENGGASLDPLGHRPESRPDGTPWTRNNLAQTIAECQSMGTGYHLSTAAEWQTMAVNASLVAANWTGGAVGSGQLYTGHSDGAVAGAGTCGDGNPFNYANSSLTACDGSDSYVGTGNNSGQAAGSGGEQRRTFALSNGSVVWDIAGNVREFVDVDGAGGSLTYTGPGVSAYYEAMSVEATSTFDGTYGGPNLGTVLFQPPNAGWGGAQGAGRFYINAGARSGKMLTRGANFSAGNYPGLFSGDMDGNVTDTPGTGGFRCVAPVGSY